MENNKKIYNFILYILLLLLGVSLGTAAVSSVLSLFRRDNYLPLLNLIAVVTFIVLIIAIVIVYIFSIKEDKRQKRKDNNSDEEK